MQKSSTKICFLFNPAAGKNRSTHHIGWLHTEAGKRWNHYEINIIRPGQNLQELARRKAAQYEVIVACGGDGTIHRVANGLVGTGAVLGILPVGSGNDFVKSVGLNNILPECLNVLHKGVSKPVDLIRIEGDVRTWCINTTGIGLDGLANNVARNDSLLKGDWAYISGALRAAFAYRGTRMEIAVDGVRSDGHYLMITACNGKWEGGRFFVAPEAEPDDGLMDLLTITTLPLPLVLSYLPRFRRGPSPGMKGVTSRKCKTAEIRSKAPVAVHADGEHLGSDIHHLILSVHKQTLPVLIPQNY